MGMSYSTAKVVITHNKPINVCSGNYEDEPEFRDDVLGEFYNIEFGSTTKRGKFVSDSLSSLREAISEAEKATNFTVTSES